MLNPSSPLAALMTAPMRPGKLEWIGLRPARRSQMIVVPDARLDTEKGIAGDRYNGKSGNRQVTLIGRENLEAISSFMGFTVGAEVLRRNLVITGINLLALKDKRFRLGEAVLEMTGECHPCSRMEESLGAGGYNAVRGHGGIIARVVEGGVIRTGDDLCVL